MTGTSGYAARYDGTTWSQPTRLSSAAGQPGSVSCPTVSFCVAVDADDSSAFLFDGTTWRSVPRINDPVPSARTGMASVSCSSPRFCAAVDNGSNAFTFNGISWSPARAIDPGNQLSTVSCPSARFCAAVDYGPNVVTFNGSAWTAPVTIDSEAAKSVNGPVLEFLMSVSCRSATFCVAGDSTGDAFVRS